MKNKDSNKPNIIFIMSDDQGPWSMHCAGNSDIITPNLDRLAETGMRFSNFYCASPVCSPARATLLTGRIPSQHGVHDWLRDGNIGKENTVAGIEENKTIEYLKGINGYTNILSEKGWNCGLSGKWHLGNSRQKQKGFSFWYAHQWGASSYYNAPMIRNGELVNEERYITDVMTDQALNFLNKTKDNNPFYLSLHYTAPHGPWINNHPEKYLSLYDNCEFDSIPDHSPHPWYDKELVIGEKKFKKSLQGYFAAVTAMDANIGRIIDWLDRHNLRKNTLVIFTSDNGFCFGHHGIVGKGNGTFPLNMYEESVKVPLIFSQPGKIPEDEVNDALVSAYDFMPTLLDYLELDYNVKQNLAGQSFKPLLKGKSMEKRDDLVVFDEYGPVRMIRTKNWKYVHRYPYGPHELYDLKNDPKEMKNQINKEKYQSKIQQLRSRLEKWFLKYVDFEVDGVREPVSGKGQINKAGIYAKNQKQYKNRSEKV